MSKQLKFNDEVVVSIAKVLQIAILSGTDIVDNLRMMKLIEAEDGIIGIHEDYTKEFDNNVSKMLEEINENKNIDEN